MIICSLVSIQVLVMTTNQLIPVITNSSRFKFGKLIPVNKLKDVIFKIKFSPSLSAATVCFLETQPGRGPKSTCLVRLCDCWIGCDQDKQCRNHCICFWTGSAGSIEEDAVWKMPKGCVRSRMYLMLEKQERVIGDDFPSIGSEWVCLGLCIIVCLIIEEDAVSA